MKGVLRSIKEFLLDLLFPVFCFGCGREGSYLCQDCLALIEILEYQYCPFCYPPKIVSDGKTCQKCRRDKKLTGLFSATSYENFLIKRIINQFKYEPLVKELAKTLASLIITHFLLLNKSPQQIWIKSILVPVPLDKTREKERGFNQAKELAKELSKILEIPLVSDCLIKIKETRPQVELKKEEREENIKGVFLCQRPEEIKGRKILLVDDIYTTGSTLEEGARVLKEAQAKEVWGVVIARGQLKTG